MSDLKTVWLLRLWTVLMLFLICIQIGIALGLAQLGYTWAVIVMLILVVSALANFPVVLLNLLPHCPICDGPIDAFWAWNWIDRRRCRHCGANFREVTGLRLHWPTSKSSAS